MEVAFRVVVWVRLVDGTVMTAPQEYLRYLHRRYHYPGVADATYQTPGNPESSFAGNPTKVGLCLLAPVLALVLVLEVQSAGYRRLPG